MKKLLTLFTLLLTVCSGAWADDYTLGASTFASTGDDKQKASTVGGLTFTLDQAHGGAGQTGYSEYIKFSKGKTYTLTLPATFTLSNINVKGYTNSNGKTNGELTSVAGSAQTGKTFPAKDDENLATNVCVTDGYDFAVSQKGGTIAFTTANTNQICVLITLTGTNAVAPGAISFNPAAGSVEENTKITLTSTGATTIKYQWGASVIDGNGEWSGATIYDNEHKPEVPSVGSPNNVLSVWAHNNDGDTYGSAAYTITAAKTVTTTTINVPGGFNTDVKTSTTAGTLTASVTAGGSPVGSATVTWASSDESIVKVGETTGVVTLVAAGTAHITATYAGNATYAASSDDYEIDVEDSRKHVTLSFTSNTLNDYNYDGETLTAPTLTAKDQNNNTIDLAELPELSFAVDKEDVVTVNAETGVITAANTNNFGTSTVTVSFPGNSNYKSAASKSYTVTRAPMLYQVKFDNGFEGFIEEGTKKVNVFYMAGTSAPAQTGTIKKADGYTATVVGNTVVLTKDTHTKTYIIDAKAKTPFEGAGKQTFSAVPDYVASVYGFEAGDGKRRLKYSKKFNLDESKTDWTREAKGNSRLYFFVGAATNIAFTHTTNNNAVKVRINGGEAVEKSGSFNIDLNADQPNMIEIQSNQTSGDGGFKDITLTSPKKAVKIGSHGWTSLISDKNLNFKDIEGLNAYAAKRSGTTVTLNDVTEVDANKGIVLRGTENETYYVPVLASTDADVDTDLTGSATADYNKVGEMHYYVLANKGGVEGFYEYTGNAAIPKGKAFFETSSEIAGGKFSIVFADDETDGIKAVSTKVENGVRYNLAGQKVGADYKGIVIVNGKKYMNK